MEKNIEENYLKSLEFIEKAKKLNAELIIFPELQLSPFFPQYEKQDATKYLIDINSKYIKGICKSCKENNIHASPNLYIRENNKNYDMSLLIDNKGNIVGKQKMVHIAQCNKFYEQDYYTPSDDGFKVFETELGKIAIIVCFDRHYPESIRTASVKGAQLIIIPTANTIEEPKELFEWEIKVQSFQNIVNIAMCNRVGIEDSMNFYGESIVTNYNGKTMSQASSNEELLIADVDMKSVYTARKNKPYLNLRKREFYE